MVNDVDSAVKILPLTVAAADNAKVPNVGAARLLNTACPRLFVNALRLPVKVPPVEMVSVTEMSASDTALPYAS